MNVYPGFRNQLRVHHVDGAVIPPFQVPLVTKLYVYTLMYTKKSKETRILKNFEFKREVGIDHCYKK